MTAAVAVQGKALSWLSEENGLWSGTAGRRQRRRRRWRRLRRRRRRHLLPTQRGLELVVLHELTQVAFGHHRRRLLRLDTRQPVVHVPHPHLHHPDRLGQRDQLRKQVRHSPGRSRHAPPRRTPAGQATSARLLEPPGTHIRRASSLVRHPSPDTACPASRRQPCRPRLRRRRGGSLRSPPAGHRPEPPQPPGQRDGGTVIVAQTRRTSTPNAKSQQTLVP